MGEGTRNRSACCPPFGRSSPVPNVVSHPGCESSKSGSSNPVDEANTDDCSSERKGFLVHSVSKSDTLPGLAIRYGVEVTDIKRVNRLVNDFDIHALNTLLIPFPGSHPPSPVHHPSSSVIAGEALGFQESVPPFRISSEKFKNSNANSKRNHSFGQNHNVSKAMELLIGYYGLNSHSLNDPNAHYSDMLRTNSDRVASETFSCMNSSSSSSLSRWALPDDDHDHLASNDVDDMYGEGNDFFCLSSNESTPSTSQMGENDVPLPHPSYPFNLHSPSSFNHCNQRSCDDKPASKNMPSTSDCRVNSGGEGDVPKVLRLSNAGSGGIKMDPVVAVIEEMAKMQENNFKGTLVLKKQIEEKEVKANQSIRRRGKSDIQTNHSYGDEGKKTLKRDVRLEGKEKSFSSEQSYNSLKSIQNPNVRRTKCTECIVYDKNKSRNPTAEFPDESKMGKSKTINNGLYLHHLTSNSIGSDGGNKFLKRNPV